MKRILSLTITIFLTSTISQAQEYVRLMENQDVSFYDIQQSFNDYWDNKSYEKGKGWKQFKRWEWFMEPRVYPTGKLPNPALTYNEFVKFKNKCVKYRNQDFCSSGNMDNPLILSDKTSDNIDEVSKKMGISKEQIFEMIIKNHEKRN